MIYGIIALVVVLALVAFFVVGFNRLRTQNVAVDEALGGIDVQLTRRADLIPNLVNTVKGYAAHEKGVLEEVTRARAGVQKAAESGSVAEKSAADALLGQALGRLMVTVEAYPDLKADQNFQQLQAELSGTEDKLAFARQYYNDAAAQLNTSIATIPWNLFAGVTGVSKRDFYDAPAGQDAPPTVTF